MYLGSLVELADKKDLYDDQNILIHKRYYLLFLFRSTVKKERILLRDIPSPANHLKVVSFIPVAHMQRYL